MNLLRDIHFLYLFWVGRAETYWVEHFIVTAVAATLRCPCFNVVVSFVVCFEKALSALNRVVGEWALEALEYFLGLWGVSNGSGADGAISGILYLAGQVEGDW